MSQPFSLSIFISFIFISIILLFWYCFLSFHCYHVIWISLYYHHFCHLIHFSFFHSHSFILFFLSFSIIFFISFFLCICIFFYIFFILFWPIFWFYNWFSKMASLLIYMQLCSFKYWSSLSFESKVNFSLRFVVPVWALLSYFGVRVGP